MDDDEPFDWTNDDHVAEVIWTQFSVAWGQMVHQHDAAGTLDSLCSGFLAGRYKLVLARDGLLLIEERELRSRDTPAVR